MLFQTCLLSSLYIQVHSSTYILVVSTYYRETLILRFTAQGELSAQLTSFNQSWFYCVVNGTPTHPDTPVRILCLHLLHLRSITSQLYLLLRCGLSSLLPLSSFRSSLFSSLQKTSFLNYLHFLSSVLPIYAYVFFKTKTWSLIQSCIHSFIYLLCHLLPVNENPPIILFPSKFLPRCFGSFVLSLFFCTFCCPPWPLPHTQYLVP